MTSRPGWLDRQMDRAERQMAVIKQWERPMTVPAPAPREALTAKLAARLRDASETCNGLDNCDLAALAGCLADDVLAVLEPALADLREALPTDLEREVARAIAGESADEMVVDQGGPGRPEWTYFLPHARRVLAILDADTILATVPAEMAEREKG